MNKPDDITKLTEEDVLQFGKYKGKSIREVAEDNPSYLLWAHREIEWFALEDALFDKLWILVHGDDDEDDGLEPLDFQAD